MDGDDAGAVSGDRQCDHASPERLLPWALVTPALAWTLIFFVLPFIAMAVSSMTDLSGGGWTFGNYRTVFRQPDLSAGDGELAGGDGDRNHRVGPARLSLCLDSG